jgi:hypothetical protein
MMKRSPAPGCSTFHAVALFALCGAAMGLLACGSSMNGLEDPPAGPADASVAGSTAGQGAGGSPSRLDAGPGGAGSAGTPPPSAGSPGAGGSPLPGRDAGADARPSACSCQDKPITGLACANGAGSYVCEQRGNDACGWKLICPPDPSSCPPSPMCDLACPGGNFAKDAQGCPVCACAGLPAPVGVVWGGNGIVLTTIEGGADVELSCATGTIESPLPAADGTVVLDGVYTRAGGPVGPNVKPPQRARYAITIEGATMTVRITLVDGDATIGPFELRKGAAGTIIYCY